MKYAISALAAIFTASQACAATLSLPAFLPAAHSLLGKVHGGEDPAPEPAAWALMLVGFVLLAVAVRLRRKAKA